MDGQKVIVPRPMTALAAIAVVVCLYLSSQYSYLLFHSVAEFFSIVIAWSMFTFSWNSRRFIENNYLVVIGIAYLFVGCIDFVHTLSYEGMGVFPEYGSNLPTQLWISARYVESLSILLSTLAIGRRVKTFPIFAGYVVLVSFLFLTIFVWHIFPVCHSAETGLTPFKKVSEYVISGILIAAAFVLRRKKDAFAPDVYKTILASIMLTILAELFLTFYFHVDDLSNFVGHVIKILSFYLVYRAIIRTGLKKPYELLLRELKQSEQSLKESNEAKDRFISILAHDLKDPFNSLFGFSELLLTSYDRFDDEKKKKYIRLIRVTLESVYRLLENLLYWSRMQVGGGEVRPKQVPLRPIARETIGLLKSSADSKGIALILEIDEETTVFADENTIRLVIRNLVSNAIKFTEQGGEVRLFSRHVDAGEELVVSDTGVGMSEEEVERLFLLDIQKSRQGTAQEKGSGLGLYLCKTFLDKNAGEIAVESTPGKGSVFRVLLPRAPVGEGGSAESLASCGRERTCC